jgi:VanZ family protein
MKYRYLLPSLVWFLAILWIIIIPGGSIPNSALFKIPHIDKFIHAFVFAVFTFLLSYGFYMQKMMVLGRYPYTFSFLTGVIYSILTEWIQMRFVAGRSGELLDILADLAGCFAGIVLFNYLKRIFPSFLQK